MKTFAICILAGVAQAATRYTSENGIDYTITMTQHGVEIPAELSTVPNLSTKGPVKASANGKRRRNTVQSTTNWCGMSNVNPPSGHWTNVEAIWTVPQISLRSGQTDADEPSIAQWVGIDGDDSCATGLIQGGTVSSINSDGSQSNYAWWEFVPDALVSISNMEVSIGDQITGNVTMTSTTSGIVELHNANTGYDISVVISNGPGELCGDSAEWILEDLTSNGLVPFAEFPVNYFELASSTTSTGTVVGAESADAVYLYQDNELLCEAGYASDYDGVVVVPAE